MTKPIKKPTRSMPKINEQGDGMEEDEGQEEWLSDGGYTDDDTLTSRDHATSSQDKEPTLQETTMPEPKQVEETVENISNQLQLEINIGEDGVAVIRRQAVRVADIKENNSTSLQTELPVKEPANTQPPEATSVSTAAQPAGSNTSASEGTADDEHSTEDPERLLDQLETFLIRKTDGKVLETKATVQTTLNDLVKKTVDDDNGDDDEQADKGDNEDDEQADKGDDEHDDADENDTDDLLSVLDDSVLRRTTRSLARLQQAYTPSTAKGKANAQASKQVTKSAEKSKLSTSQRRTATRTSSVTNRRLSLDDKPVILSQKVLHLTNKTSSQKKSNSNQNSSQKDKKTSKDPTSMKDKEVIKQFASKNSQGSQQLAQAVVKVERVDAKLPTMAISKTNFGDTYNTFIQKQSIANKSLDSILKKTTVKRNNSPKVYKRKASSFKDKGNKIDPFDKLLQNTDDESFEQSPKIRRLSIDSSSKSPIINRINFETSASNSKNSKTNFKSNISPKISKANEGTNKILTILEKNTNLSIKSSSPGNNNKIQTITRKAVTELPKSQSPKVQTPKGESTKFFTPKMQSPISNNSSVQKRALSNVSTKIREYSPSGLRYISPHKPYIIKRNLGADKTTTASINSKNFVNKGKLKDNFDDDQMASDFDDQEMPEWPGTDDDDDDDEQADKPSGKPQRLQEGIPKKAEPMQRKLADRDMEDGSTEFDSEDMDDTDFDDFSPSESDSLYGDMFSMDLREERATEYLPLLGEKANEILEREKRSVLQKLSTIRQGLKSLNDNAKKNQTEIDMAKLKIMELNTLMRQP